MFMRLFLTIIILNLCIFFGNNGTNFYGAKVIKNQTVQELNVSGNAQLEKVTVNGNVTINGPAVFNTVTVTKNMNVTGPLTANNLKINGALHVYGAVIIKDSQVAGMSSIHGYFEAKKSVLHSIEITTKRLVLSNSHTGTIKVKIDTSTENTGARVWEKKQQVVELDNTQVKGDIIFEQNNGQVILKNGAKISGKVIGGVIK